MPTIFYSCIYSFFHELDPFRALDEEQSEERVSKVPEFTFHHLSHLILPIRTSASRLVSPESDMKDDPAAFFLIKSPLARM